MFADRFVTSAWQKTLPHIYYEKYLEANLLLKISWLLEWFRQKYFF